MLDPFGLTLPFKIAEFDVMSVAEPVVTVGLVGSVVVVVLVEVVGVEVVVVEVVVDVVVVVVGGDVPLLAVHVPDPDALQ